MLTHHHHNDRDNDDYEGIYSKDGVSISNSQRSNAASWVWGPNRLGILFIVSIVIVVVVVIFIVSAVIFIILALKLG